jgi:G3E family GTPase
MIPLALLASFFGAGKTRFLLSIIPELHARGLRTHVLLNDFESAEIDATRLTTLTSLVTLSGECVCCSSVEELLTALRTMPVEPSSVVLIEANGATETEELIDRLTTERRLARYTLPLQVTIVDAKRWQKRWWHNGARGQPDRNGHACAYELDTSRARRSHCCGRRRNP